MIYDIAAIHCQISVAIQIVEQWRQDLMTISCARRYFLNRAHAEVSDGSTLSGISSSHVHHASTINASENRH